MNNLQTFNYKDKEVRAVEINGELWCSLSDVCKVLGVSDPLKAISRLDEDEQTTFKIGNQDEIHIINESGLYNAILRSNSLEAKQFRKWVSLVVVPSVRKPADLISSDVELKSELTSEDYLAAARLVASCNRDSLSIVVGLLLKGGWQITSVPTKTLKEINTTDISVRIKKTAQETGLTLKQISKLCGVNEGSFRSYASGNKFPRSELYERICSVLDNLSINTKKIGGDNE